MTRGTANRTGVLATLLLAQVSLAYCPSYTLSSSSNTSSCGLEASPGTNPTTAEWKAIFARVSQGPSAWGTDGPAVGSIGQGCGKPMPSTSTAAHFPCELLEALTWQESGWKQFCVPDRPADQVGGASRTLISFDCGYGVGQVTSGMHTGESPNFDRARVTSEPAYNLATGTLILAEKWRATSCVGDNQPDVIEDWYLATWAYNGLAAVNNPNNPNYSSTRGVWNPVVSGSAPYQELIFGWAEFPPSTAHWAPLALAYPRLTDIGSSNNPSALPEPSCASPTSCAQTRAVHRSACAPSGADAGQGGGGGGSGGGSGSTGGGRGAGGGSAGAGGGGLPSGDGGLDAADGGTSGLHAQGGCGCRSGSLPWPALLALGGLLGRRRRAE